MGSCGKTLINLPIILLLMFEILSRISLQGEPGDYGLPAIKNAEPVPLDAGNFHPVEPVDNLKVGFVDGGNNIIFLSPGQAVHMVRLYYSIFENGRKVEFGRYTFVANSSIDVNEDSFHVQVFDVDGSRIFPEEMKIGVEEIDEREKIKGVGAYLRRIGEWLLMKRIADKCDVLVRDGSLQTGEKREYEYSNQVFASISDKVLVGFSKTCSLLTTRGFSLTASIHHLSLKSGVSAPWYYHPIARNISTIKGDMFMVKLHPFSDYVFRVEVYPQEYAPAALGALVPYSNDPTFIGYPYGLIDADVNARISEEEAKIYRTMLYNNADAFSRMQANAVNAHDLISEVR